MSTATLSETQKARNTEIANTILSQIRVMVRGCLDMKGSKCYSIENGLIAKNVIVTATNRRGDIKIVLNGKDLYDITVTRVSPAKGAVVLHEWEDIGVENLNGVLNCLWTGEFQSIGMFLPVRVNG